eukprot:g3689.t1
MRRSCRVPLTSAKYMRSKLLPSLPLPVAHNVQEACKTKECSIATVMGYTTPAIEDIGGSSLRIKFDDILKSGGYILGIRPRSGTKVQDFLPAIAGIPGEKGLDRNANSRDGFGELMILARPLHKPESDDKIMPRVTFLPEDVLQKLYPESSTVEIVVLDSLTDFFLGLNSGRWLLIRLNQLCQATESAYDNNIVTDSSSSLETTTCFQHFLENTNIAFNPQDLPEDPPTDKSWLFNHYVGSSSSLGVSGQKIIHSPEKSKMN